MVPRPWKADDLVLWVARSFAKGIPESYPRPEGYIEKTLASHDSFLEEFERQAQAWQSEADVKSGLAEARLALDVQMSLDQRMKCIEVLKRGPTRRGRGADPFANRARDNHITVNVIFVKLLGRLQATRNDVSEHPSACSIVADGMKKAGFVLSEKSINRIYKRTMHALTAGHPTTNALAQAGIWADEKYGNETQRLVRLIYSVVKRPQNTVLTIVHGDKGSPLCSTISLIS